jgi:hypothetical protein
MSVAGVYAVARPGIPGSINPYASYCAKKGAERNQQNKPLHET